MAKLHLIRDIAAEQHKSMTSIAQDLGLSLNGLGLIIRKNKTDIAMLEKIADLLHVSPSVFLDGKYKESLPEPKDPKDEIIETLQKDLETFRICIESQNAMIQSYKKRCKED